MTQGTIRSESVAFPACLLSPRDVTREHFRLANKYRPIQPTGYRIGSTGAQIWNIPQNCNPLEVDWAFRPSSWPKNKVTRHQHEVASVQTETEKSLHYVSPFVLRSSAHRESILSPIFNQISAEYLSVCLSEMTRTSV
jgi:hypothetical protein